MSIIIILSLNVSAWGVTSFYTNPITIYPGQVQEIEYWLQNIADNHDMYITANVVKGSEFFSIDSKNNYFVKQGIKDVKVHGKIDIPSDAQIGDEYYIEIKFEESLPQTNPAGAVGVGTSVSKVIEVLVKEQPTSTSKFLSQVTSILTLVGVILVVLVILYCFIKKEMKLINKIKRKK